MLSLFHKLAIFYVTAAAAVPVAWLGIHTFSLSAVGQGKGWPLVYTTTEYLCILAVCVLGPYAVAAFVVSAGNVAAARHVVTPVVRSILAAVHAVVFASLAVLAYRWGGYDVLRCGIVGCIEGAVDSRCALKPRGALKPMCRCPHLRWHTHERAFRTPRQQRLW
jgi:hypothetical protein